MLLQTLQTAKLHIKAFYISHYWSFRETSQYHNWQDDVYTALPGNKLSFLWLNSVTLTISPQTRRECGYATTVYT